MRLKELLMLKICSNSKMKRKLKIILELIAFISIISILLLNISNITKRKYSYQKSFDFLKQE